MLDIPVILIAYNRAKHTKEVLDALKKHRIANLYVFSDAPRSEDDRAAVDEVRFLLKNIDWVDAKIIYQAENQGLAKSIVSAVDLVFENHDRLILLEDDCVPGERFFDFMQAALDKYETNEKVFGVSGYGVSIPEDLKRKYEFDAYFIPRIGSWGWATWKSAWLKKEDDLVDLYQKLEDDNIDLAQGGSDVPRLLNDMVAGRVKDVWTLSWLLTVYLNKGYYVYPVESHIKNIGMDGTGVHCGATDKFESKVAVKFSNLLPEEVFVDQSLLDNFRTYYDHPIQNKTKRPLRVVHLCSHNYGGAGNAAYRLHQVLLASGIDSKLLVANKRGNDFTVRVLPFDKERKNCTIKENTIALPWRQTTQKWMKMLEAYKEPNENIEIFSDVESSINLSVREIEDADIVNLHWIPGLCDLRKFKELYPDKKIVWTLHDMNAFTGGCHYSGTCERYKSSCGLCPILGSNEEDDISREIYEKKLNSYKDLNLHIVTPSKWLAECSSGSSLLKQFPVSVIANSLNVNIFKPYPKDDVRKILNISSDAFVMMFCAASTANTRKGFSYLVNALDSVARGMEGRELVLLVAGAATKIPQVPESCKVVALGHVDNQAHMAAYYSAADVFVLPSIEDNLPNTALEAQACGVPVVGFKIGGMTDIIIEAKTGFLADEISSDSLAKLIIRAAEVEDQKLFRYNCRKHAIARYSPKQQLKAYADLYISLIKDKVSQKVE